MNKKLNFTLIELMGAMVISTILLASLMKIFGSSTQLMSKKFQEIDATTDARFAISSLTRDLTELYANEGDPDLTPMTFSSSLLEIYSNGSIERPLSSDEKAIAEAVSAPQFISYSFGSGISKSIEHLDTTPIDSGDLITSGLENFSLQAYYYADNTLQPASNFPLTYTNSASENVTVTKPFAVVISFDMKDPSGRIRKYKKTVITDSIAN